MAEARGPQHQTRSPSSEGQPHFESLFETSGLTGFDLPKSLERAYGRFGLASSVVYGNFVASVDGIVAIPGVSRASSLISGGDPADRFLVALLRAAADAIVIGAGTFRQHEGPWTAEHAYPDPSAQFAEMRRREGMRPHPMLVVVTGSGNIGEDRSKVDGGIIVTTAEGAGRLGAEAGSAAEVISLGATASVDVREVVHRLSERGYSRILMEGGPMLMGEALKAGVVNELFLTVSPVIAGAGQGGTRPTLAAGVDLLPASLLSGRLLSVHRRNDYLFLRYALDRQR
jgi:riboflavin biosynthesis pyrimidine reductase